MLNSVEFPAVIELDDDELITNVTGLNLEDLKEYSVTQHMMSAHLIEITIVKPKEGKLNDVIDLLEAHKDSLINEVALKEAIDNM